MHRAFRALGATALIVAISAAGGAVAAAAPDRPNILLITTDDQTFESLRSMPHVWQMRNDGTRYTRYYANFPLCCPSRATILTGQYTHNHNVWQNGPAGGGGYAALHPTHDNTLPVWLQNAGYQTVMLGKYVNHYYLDNHGIPPGWDKFRVSTQETAYHYKETELVHEDGRIEDHGTKYKTDLYARLADQLIGEMDSDRPFFMWVSFNAPHIGDPQNQDDSDALASASPPKRYRNQMAGTNAPAYRTWAFNEPDVSDKPRHIRNLPKLSASLQTAIHENYSQQLEALRAVDDAVARIRNALSRTGQLENTVIAFTTDNGYYYGEHRIRSGKSIPYGAASRMPLIVVGPGFTPGQVATEPRLNTDLAATFVEIAGASPGRELDGVPLTTGSGAWRTLLQEGSIPTGSGRVKYFIHRYAAVRTPNWFYGRYHYNDGGLGVELYNLKNDPNMLHNVRTDGRYDAKKTQLRQRLEQLQTE